jgi:hypothetical protein
MRNAKAEHVEQPSFNAIRSVALPRGDGRMFKKSR